VSDDEDSPAPAGPAASAGRAGRRAGVALFWLMGVFLIGTSSRSIIPALYFMDAAPRPQAQGAARCQRELSALQSEMSRAAAESLQSASITPWSSRAAGWDGRLHALEQGCGELERTREDLLRLHGELESMLRRYGSERGAMQFQQRVRGALAALPESDATDS
jgi:hypothetical protein